MNNKKTLKIMITGHRPNKLGGYDEDNHVYISIKNQIKERLSQWLESYDIIGISGMALGADMMFCEVCLELNIPYVSYVPFNGQDRIWPDASKKKYKALLEQSKEIKIISNGGYSPKKMQIRNESMAKDCDFAIAVWNGSNGGTSNCVNYLKKIGKKILVIDPKDFNSASKIF